ncbi:uncharacterized protein LOC111321108 [Stylophora pistillata]|nr:uncharacterized protein LOC111321108 [Stylophora pistillata]
MGCSPSHAVIINSSPTHETICLQPRIYMVSESTLCLLQDVGELKVYNIDERNPQTAIERFRGAQDQLQNPLLFHPHLRSRHKRISEGDLQSAGSASIASDPLSEENARVGEIARNDEGSEVCSESSDKISDNTNTQIQTESPGSSNAHSVTVEVYSYQQNSGELEEQGKARNGFETTENTANEPSITVNTGTSAVSEESNHTSDERDNINESFHSVENHENAIIAVNSNVLVAVAVNNKTHTNSEQGVTSESFKNAEDLDKKIIAGNSGASVTVPDMERKQTFPEHVEINEMHALRDAVDMSDTTNEPTLIAWKEFSDQSAPIAGNGT